MNFGALDLNFPQKWVIPILQANVVAPTSPSAPPPPTPPASPPPTPPTPPSSPSPPVWPGYCATFGSGQWSTFMAGSNQPVLCKGFTFPNGQQCTQLRIRVLAGGGSASTGFAYQGGLSSISIGGNLVLWATGGGPGVHSGPGGVGGQGFANVPNATLASGGAGGSSSGSGGGGGGGAPGSVLGNGGNGGNGSSQAGGGGGAPGQNSGANASGSSGGGGASAIVSPLGGVPILGGSDIYGNQAPSGTSAGNVYAPAAASATSLTGANSPFMSFPGQSFPGGGGGGGAIGSGPGGAGAISGGGGGGGGGTSFAGVGGAGAAWAGAGGGAAGQNGGTSIVGGGCGGDGGMSGGGGGGFAMAVIPCNAGTVLVINTAVGNAVNFGGNGNGMIIIEY